MSRSRASHRLTLLLVLLWPVTTGGGGSGAPCLRPSKAGTQVQGEVRVCPGRYRIPDRGERGVIIAAASGTRIDLTGVVLESGDSVPARFTGIGVASRGVDGVSVLGGAVRGYRVGLRLEGGRDHRIIGVEVSGSRSAPLRSTESKPDTADRLDLHHRDAIATYGSGIILDGTVSAIVTGITAKGAQNGIGLIEARESYIGNNEVTGNTGWGIHLWRSSRNLIVRNRVHHTARCAPPALDCGASAILLREGSDSNTIAENDLTSSSLGLRLTGEAPLTRPSIGNLIHRNDASWAAGPGFLAAYTWGANFLENRADSAEYGFQLVHVNGSTLQRNTVIGARKAAITTEQGSDDTFESNTLIGSRIGVLATGDPPAQRVAESRGHRIYDNIIGETEQAIVLQRTTGSRIRGNLLDGVGNGLVIDGAGHGTEVTGNIFLRASGWFIEAPDLAAGGNYWATADAAAAAARVKGRITVLPWRPASLAGY